MHNGRNVRWDHKGKLYRTIQRGRFRYVRCARCCFFHNRYAGIWPVPSPIIKARKGAGKHSSAYDKANSALHRMYRPSSHSIPTSLLARIYLWRFDQLHKPSTWQYRILKPSSSCLHITNPRLHIACTFTGPLNNIGLRAIQSLSNRNHGSVVFDSDSMDCPTIRSTQSMGSSSYCPIRHNTLYRNVFYSHVERSAVLSRHCRHNRASVRPCCD